MKLWRQKKHQHTKEYDGQSQGRDEWKIKAQLRREEKEKLKLDLQSREAWISELIEENQKAKDQLVLFQQKIKEGDQLIKKLKKTFTRATA